MIFTLKSHKAYSRTMELVLEPRQEEKELLIVMQPSGGQVSTMSGGMMAIPVEELYRALSFCEQLLGHEA